CNDSPPCYIYTPSPHDALPIFRERIRLFYELFVVECIVPVVPTYSGEAGKSNMRAVHIRGLPRTRPPSVGRWWPFVEIPICVNSADVKVSARPALNIKLQLVCRSAPRANRNRINKHSVFVDERLRRSATNPISVPLVIVISLESDRVPVRMSIFDEEAGSGGISTTE